MDQQVLEQGCYPSGPLELCIESRTNLTRDGYLRHVRDRNLRNWVKIVRIENWHKPFTKDAGWFLIVFCQGTISLQQLRGFVTKCNLFCWIFQKKCWSILEILDLSNLKYRIKITCGAISESLCFVKDVIITKVLAISIGISSLSTIFHALNQNGHLKRSIVLKSACLRSMRLILSYWMSHSRSLSI